MTEVVVSELEDLMSCRGCVTTEFAILNALVDRDLADAAICLTSHTNLDDEEAINRSEYNRHTITMEGIGTLADAHVSFLEYTLNTHTRLYRHVSDRYRDIIDREFDILPERIDVVHRAGIGNPELTGRFEHFASLITGSPVDREPVKIALRANNDPYSQAPLNVFPNAEAKRLHQRQELERGLLMAFVPEARTVAGMYEVPRWVVQVMRAVNPGRVASGELGDVDERVLETAVKIWSQDPNEELFDFDTALRSAGKLVGV